MLLRIRLKLLNRIQLGAAASIATAAAGVERTPVEYYSRAMTPSRKLRQLTPSLGQRIKRMDLSVSRLLAITLSARY